MDFLTFGTLKYASRGNSSASSDGTRLNFMEAKDENESGFRSRFVSFG